MRARLLQQGPRRREGARVNPWHLTSALLMALAAVVCIIGGNFAAAYMSFVAFYFAMICAVRT